MGISGKDKMTTLMNLSVLHRTTFKGFVFSQDWRMHRHTTRDIF